MPKPVKPPHAKKAQKSGKPGAAPSGRVTPKATGRYTPPVPRSEKVSPRWVPVVMFASLGLGMLVILANYVSLLPGGEPSNMYLLVGLVLITIGFITATKFH
ncbi:MAG TPA: cell division protein CrgA [Acidimicrobiales bacterium]|nr:cell division protein CrgA [Acidimicrobiales bacterium]